MAIRREEQIKQLVSREYRIYQEEERLSSLPRTLYEKACRVAEKINVHPDAKTKKKFEEAIEFSHLRATPKGVASLTILFALVVSVPTIILIALELFTALPGMPFGFGILTLLLGAFFTVYLYLYPLRLKKKYEMETGAEIVTSIIYISMYMRNTPNLEGAVQFASENLTGNMGYELKKLVWDVEVGNYLSMEDALSSYVKKWSGNRPFIEAVEMLITSLKQGGERRTGMLDEAVDVILKGNREQAQHFNQELKLPVMIVHAMGIVLPIMGLVLFPIVAVFLKVQSSVLFVGYDILLPMILYFVITHILDKRPSTFSRIDIKDNPDVPEEGKFRLGKRQIKAWPVSLAAGTLVLAAGILMIPGDEEGILSSLVILAGVAVGFASYFISLSSQRMKVRETTRQIEEEFAEALFQMGNQISGGRPIEVSMESSMDRIKNLRIREMFQRALRNMRNLGMTFRQAFFDEEYGAIRYYPSRLIKSIMRTIVESTRKGVNVASVAMLSVSRYLKSLHDTQEEVQNELSDAVNSLKFQLYFLSPMIAGVVTTMAIVIIRILRSISIQTSGASGFGVSLPFADFSSLAITPFEFVLIVGIYIIETAFILSMFVNSIESGEDPIGQKYLTGYSLIVGYVVFAVSLFVTLGIFGPLITAVV